MPEIVLGTRQMAHLSRSLSIYRIRAIVTATAFFHELLIHSLINQIIMLQLRAYTFVFSLLLNATRYLQYALMCH